MMRRKIEESWSIRKPKGMDNFPTEIKSNKGVLKIVPFFTPMNNITDNIKEARIVPLPIKPDNDFDRLFLKSPFIIKPIKGNNGTR
jgi:hypothetical protein